MIKMILTKKHKNGDKEYIYPKTSSDLVLLGNNKSLSDKLNDFNNTLSLLNSIDLDRLKNINTLLYNALHNSNFETSPDSIAQNLNNVILFMENVVQGIYNSGTDLTEEKIYVDECKTLIDEIRQPLIYGMIQDRNTITRITIPENIDTIAGYAFRNCNNLEEIYIPDNITSIGEYAFASISKLKNVRLSNNLKSIPNYCFAYTPIQEITIPEGVTSIGERAFSSCRSLTNITLPNTLTIIHQRGFQDLDSLVELTLPNNLTTICMVGFCSCNNLERVNIDIENSKLNDIDTQAFDYAPKLKTFPFPKSISYIGSQVFKQTGLEEVIIPDTDHDIRISGLNFADCTNLRKVYLSANVKLIKCWMNNVYMHFKSCTNLEDVTLGNGFNSVGLDLSASEKYTKETILQWLNALYDRTGLESYNLIIGQANINKLLDDDIAIATNKNWTLS